MKPKTLRINLTKNQIKKIKKELLEPNNIKCDGVKRFGLIAQPTMLSEILIVCLLNKKEFNVIDKAWTSLKKGE